MVGGYMAFSGINATSRYGETAIKDVLPVECLTIDDRREHPEGIVPVIKEEHSILEGIPSSWPAFLGYNKTILKEGSKELATIGEDPFIAYAEFGKGIGAAFTSDCAPHWGPKEFVEWEHYDAFWGNLADFLTE